MRKKNGGLSSARNAGLRAARSRYIAFLDADDLLEPIALASGLACFERKPESAMVYGGHRRIDADGKAISNDIYHALGTDPYADLLTGNYVGMHAAVLYRREILIAIGGFDEGLRRCEDYDMYLRLARDYHVASHPEIVAEYRWHGRNISRNPRKMLKSVLCVLDRHRDQTAGRAEAWQRGRENWSAWYGREMAADLGAFGTLRERAIIRAQRLRARIGTARDRFLPRTWPPKIGRVDFGDLGTTRPVSLDFGWDRGDPVDRFYIETFLAGRAADIRGRVLEVGDDAYSRRYGGANVTHQDVLHVDGTNPKATLTGDLSSAGTLPHETFDCIVLTQTLQLIFDLPQAVACLYAALKPGGVLLLTVPGISQLDRHRWGAHWYWAFTTLSIRRLFESSFGTEALNIESHGNVYAAIAFLTGVVRQEVDTAKLEENDPAYPVIITVRASR